MKEIMEEYGEALLAVIGSLAVLAITGVIFFGQVSEQVILYVAHL